MSRQLITQPRGQGVTWYALVASTEPNFEALEQHMKEKDVPIDPFLGFPDVYIFDYRTTGNDCVGVVYQGPKLDLPDLYNLISRPILAVLGLEQQIVEAEANEMIDCMGETEDPESVQLFVAKLHGII